MALINKHLAYKKETKNTMDANSLSNIFENRPKGITFAGLKKFKPIQQT